MNILSVLKYAVPKSRTILYLLLYSDFKRQKRRRFQKFLFFNQWISAEIFAGTALAAVRNGIFNIFT